MINTKVRRKTYGGKNGLLGKKDLRKSFDGNNYSPAKILDGSNYSTAKTFNSRIKEKLIATKTFL